MPVHGVAPVKQSFIGRHERRTVDERGGDNETIGRIIMQAGKFQRTHRYRPIERQLNCAGRKHCIAPFAHGCRQPETAARLQKTDFSEHNRRRRDLPDFA